MVARCQRFSLASTFVRSVRVAPVAGFAVVALRHPDGLHRQPVAALALDQVALRAVHGLEDLDDPGRPTCQPSAASLLAQGLGQSRDFAQFRNPLTIDGFGQLAAAPGRFAHLRHQRRQRLRVQAKERPFGLLRPAGLPASNRTSWLDSSSWLGSG